ncbi:hypothetical protein MEI_00946 [Bartonella vinsonii subsp. arupensis Pm136co]|uniref:Uncharacterized protein n=1 Tax=Bartonella vinsonii subsp. arupensis Pm136co TaxID=1094561 RepID=A0ABN0GPA4_BARVI|nr:hypothetical protein [Bartonella vinsonii]EJF98024.1 hypothetical protein MEI_00946 [Bartonella vinsonii subsp. arupensis Pm136co]
MAVTWDVVLKAVVFCCIAGDVLVFAHKGAKRMGLTWWELLIGVALLALLEISLVWLIREQDGLMLRALLFLKWVTLPCMIGIVLGFACNGGFVGFAYNGAKSKAVRRRWFSRDVVCAGILGFTFPFIGEGVRCVGIVWNGVLKAVGF